jgi:hypothetical protein
MEEDAEDRPCNSEAEEELDEDGRADMGTALLIASWKSISMSRNPFSNEAMISSLERLLVSSPPFFTYTFDLLYGVKCWLLE